jgi:hypothetical protein
MSLTPRALRLTTTGRLYLRRHSPFHQPLLRSPPSSILRLSSPPAIPTRTMATATPNKPEYIVIVPDKEGALSKRLEIRP